MSDFFVHWLNGLTVVEVYVVAPSADIDKVG